MSKNIGHLEDKNGNSLFPDVMEVVNNANGTALKFTNGIMICYGTKLFANQNGATDYWSTFNRTPENLSCDFPVAFIGELPIITYGCYSTSGGRVSFYQTRQCTLSKTHNFGILYVKNNVQSTDVYVSYTAIGRWK